MLKRRSVWELLGACTVAAWLRQRSPTRSARSVEPFPHHVDNRAEPTYCEVCGQSHGLGELNSLEIPSEVELDQLDPGSFERYTGFYRSARHGFALTVTAEDSGLMIRAGDDAPARLAPISRNRFWGPLRLRVPLRFEFEGAGHAQRLVIERPWPNEPVVLERSNDNERRGSGESTRQ